MIRQKIEERIAMELYGNIVYKVCEENLKKNNPDITDEKLKEETFRNLHEVIVKGFDSVKEL